MKTPSMTPSPDALSKSEAGVDRSKSDRSIFIAAVLNLTWQMAIVVLVPIVGGYYLDKYFHTVPLITIVGFVVSSFCVAIVLKQQLEMFGPTPTASKSDSNKVVMAGQRKRQS